MSEEPTAREVIGRADARWRGDAAYQCAADLAVQWFLVTCPDPRGYLLGAGLTAAEADGFLREVTRQRADRPADQPDRQ